jgi:hypothetical protein
LTYSHVDYSQHKFLLLPPLVLIIVFCFGFVTMDSPGATTASQAKAASSRGQTELSQPGNLPAMTPAPTSNGNQASPAAAGSPATPAAGSTGGQTAAGGGQLQPAPPNNQTPAAGPVGQPLLNGVLDTVTKNLPLF